MRLRRAGLSLAVLALAAASVAPKLPGAAAPQPQPPAAVLARMLERGGFSVSDVTSDADLPMLSAQAPGCRMLVGIVAPQGWHRDVVRRMAVPGTRLAYVVDGAVGPEQPPWRLRARRIVAMAQRHFGADVPVPAVYAVVAEPGCRLEDLRWGGPT